MIKSVLIKDIGKTKVRLNSYENKATDKVMDITEKPKDDKIPESDMAIDKVVDVTEKLKDHKIPECDTATDTVADITEKPKVDKHDKVVHSEKKDKNIETDHATDGNCDVEVMEINETKNKKLMM